MDPTPRSINYDTAHIGHISIHLQFQYIDKDFPLESCTSKSTAESVVSTDSCIIL